MFARIRFALQWLAQLPPITRTVLLAAPPVWLVCFALHVDSVINDRFGLIGIYVNGASGAEAYPTFDGYVPGGADGVEVQALSQGDELLEVGGRDLRGRGVFATVILAQGEWQNDRLPELTARRGDETLTAELPVVSMPVPSWWPSLFSLSFAVVGLIVVVRAPQSRSARITFLAFMSWSFSWLIFIGGSASQAAAGILVYGASMLFAGPLLLQAAMALPEQALGQWRLMFYLPWIFAIMSPVAISAFVGAPLSAEFARVAHPALQVAVYCGVLAALAANYFSSDPVGRRQVRWVLFGFFAAMIPAAVVTGVVAAYPQQFLLYTLSGIGFPLIPVGFLIAIVWYDLFDVNRLISNAASYTLLSVAVIAGMLMVVPRFAEAVSAVVGLDSTLGEIALSVMLVGAALPAHRRLRPKIDQWFFPERHALEHAVRGLIDDLQHSETADALLTECGSRLSQIGSVACVVFARTGDALGAVYVDGSGVPLTLDLSGPASELLQRGNRAVEVPALLADAAVSSEISERDRARLQALGSGVLLPVRGQGELAALIFVGAKSSGDVYTQAELTLLGAAAHELASELQQFRTAELVAQANVMQQRMRRYVPGAIARQLESGEEMEEGPRDVSILFVDIRGYTSISESLSAKQVFSTVNSYTECVSNVVEAHGGTIVEFNGDGLMTVFGAPAELAEKETAAVDAAYAIVQRLKQMVVPQRAGNADGGRLQVGIGIATGSAFVGNIRAVDRYIWSAIGNTTNLAARLQSLTRDLGATIIIDKRTHSQAGSRAVDFKGHGAISIRGRSDTIEVYSVQV
ncbi:MAG: adenylate/guanylate cyclase domain-containing protein [Pseudomonadales bacterium]